MHRFYLPISLEGQDRFEITDPGVAHQMMRVLRMKVGDQIVLFNGTGVDFLCEIEELEKRRVTGKVVSQERSNAERDVSIHLYQAVPHTWSKFEDVLKKCTEIGVTDFYPLLTERCETRLKDGEEPPKEERLNKIIIEACEQCGASVLPKLHNVIGLESAIKSAPGLKIMAYECEDVRALEDLMPNIKEEVSIFIGPEGGWEAQEAETFQDGNGFTFHLGKRILRTETAPVAVCARIVL